ncbi:MAG: hypothetical protein KC503_27175 [Myxococcales bacterium]|nr:hypothetical protein [Myxococcales bacterium]
MGQIIINAPTAWRWVSTVEKGEAHPDYVEVYELSVRDLGPYFAPLTFEGWLENYGAGKTKVQTKAKTWRLAFSYDAVDGDHAWSFAELSAALASAPRPAHRAKRLATLIEKAAAKRAITDKDRAKVEKQLAKVGAASTANFDEVKLLPDPGKALQAAEYVVANGVGLLQVHDAIFALPKLAGVFFEHSLLETVPDAVADASGLKYLHLANSSRLQALPESIGKCSALESIDASNCYWLARLPEAIGELAALKTLKLSSTALDALPDSIGRCSALETLELANEELVELPRSLGKIKSLEAIKLGARAHDHNAQWLKKALPKCKLTRSG